MSMTKADFIVKRCFDLICAVIGLILLSPLIILILLLVKFTSKGKILFRQTRVGRHGELFTIYKFLSMIVNASNMTNGCLTLKDDARITPFGKFLRKWKLDELPTLWNVLVGDMSFVGPRPDVPGYMDTLEGKYRILLQLRPGVTGPATLKYCNEGQLLAEVDDPLKYNDEVIFPDKVRINYAYMENWSIVRDIMIILQTIFRSNY